MINIFFDTEFSHLQGPLDPEPAVLISIGCVSQDDRKFYAESSSFQVEHCSEFVVQTVLPLLEGGDVSMPYTMIAKQLKDWIESFDDKVTLCTDSPYHDFGYVQHMFDSWGWPANLNKKPHWLAFGYIMGVRFANGVEEAFRTIKPELRRHHALDDAIANKFGFQQATSKRFG